MTMGITNTGFVIWLILIGYLALVGLYVTFWYLWRGIKKMFKRGQPLTHSGELAEWIQEYYDMKFIEKRLEEIENKRG
jgi:O-antigen/teichoic acid export membrane protein